MKRNRPHFFVPQTLSQLQAMPPPRATHLVEYIGEDSDDLKKGDLFEACRYIMDPTCKWTLLKRVWDGSEPSRTGYMSEFKVVEKIGS